MSLAQAGQRVLHIDADMRRPRVHEIFDVPQEPGLSNLLVGDCKPSEAVRKGPAVPELCVLPAGMIPPNPAELLGSKRCEEYIATLGEHFDWVRDRFAARAGRRRRVGGRQSAHPASSSSSARTRRADRPRKAARRPAARGAGARDRRGAEPRRTSSGTRTTTRVLLPQGVQPLLRKGAVPDLIAASDLQGSRREALMRISFLSVSAGLGGAERVLLDSIAALRTRHAQWALSVVCLAEGPLTAEVAALGADVSRAADAPRLRGRR